MSSSAVKHMCVLLLLQGCPLCPTLWVTDSDGHSLDCEPSALPKRRTKNSSGELRTSAWRPFGHRPHTLSLTGTAAATSLHRSGQPRQTCFASFYLLTTRRANLSLYLSFVAQRTRTLSRRHRVTHGSGPGPVNDEQSGRLLPSSPV